MKIWTWIKNNKFLIFLLLMVGLLLFKDHFLFLPITSNAPGQLRLNRQEADLAPTSGFLKSSSRPLSAGQIAPQPEIKERLVVETSNLSLVVDDVRQKMDQFLDYIKTKGGYLVSSSLNQPQEAPFATLVVRVPSQELQSTLAYLRGLAVKVTSENLKGQDVTDEYLDIEARLNTLQKTKAKFEEIMEKAVKVDEILKVQREIINLQTQIDSLKGRQQYLEKTAASAKLTVYLSTDEWSLPYTPQKPSFRPKLIFKQAVRSLVQTSRGLAEKLIWIGVYSPIWLPVLLVIWLIKRKKKQLPPQA